MPSAAKHLERLTLPAPVRSLQLLGRSVEGRRIEAFVHRSVRRRAPCVLILGGMHGNEPKSAHVCRQFLAFLADNADPARRATWVVAPVVNPDGLARRRRKNARGVDINRNFPTKNWERSSARSRMFGGERAAGEPETRAIMHAVERFQPTTIVTVHSIDRARFCNNYDGPGRALAIRMRRHNGYPVRGSIGYPTPGSFGTWAGAERGIPTITLELPSHHSAKRCWLDNQHALLSTPWCAELQVH